MAQLELKLVLTVPPSADLHNVVRAAEKAALEAVKEKHPGYRPVTREREGNLSL